MYLLILALLISSYIYKYLLFHTMAELFIICIALNVFIITWTSRAIIKNNYLLMVGASYIFIGILNIFHTMSYSGMNIFTYNYDYTTQLWVAMRYFDSIVLLLSILSVGLKRSFSVPRLIAVYFAVTAAILLSVFVFRVFPAAFVAGAGLTPFKKISEYIISAIFLAAIFILRRKRNAFDPRVYRYLLLSQTAAILSELSFTLYANPYGLINMIGHLLEIVSFFFIYKAVIETGLKEPYNLIFREMKETERQLYEQNTLLTKQTLADNMTAREHLALLREQYTILNRQALLLDLSQEAIFVWDADGAIFYWNRGAELMYGFSRAEAIGQRSSDLLHTIRGISMEEMMSLLDRDGTWVGTITHTTKDGRQLLVESSHQLYTDDNRRKMILEHCRDITEKSALEAELRYSNSLMNAVLENMHDALFVFDSNARLTSVNARARDMYGSGISEDATVGSLFSELNCYTLDNRFVPFDDYDVGGSLFQSRVSNERMIMENGDWCRVIEVNATPILDSADQLIAFVICHHDITDLIRKQHEVEAHAVQLQRDMTERQAMQTELSYRNNLLHAVIENMHGALFVFDSTGKVTMINAAARRMYGIDLTDATSVNNFLSGYRCLSLDRTPMRKEQFPTWRAMRGERVNNVRLFIERGSWSRVVEVNATPIADAKGMLSTLVVSHYDVTELILKQQQIEEHILQLQKQNMLLSRQSLLLDLSQEAIFAWGLDGPIVYWNNGAEKIYGFSDRDAVGSTPHKLLNSRFSVGYGELRTALVEDGYWSGNIEHMTKDGRRLIIETRMQVIPDETGVRMVLETNRDVTERIRAENEIRRNAVELKNIINSTDDLIWSVDASYKIILCNKGVYDFILQNFGIAMDPGVPFLEVLPKSLADAYLEFFERAKKDGEFSVDMPSFQGDKYFGHSFHPVYLDGALLEIIIFGRDMTERIRAEQEVLRLNASLEARIQERTRALQESMDTITNLTMMVTHDLKTPLYEIGTYAEEIRNGREVGENADKIRGISADMNVMIGELLEYDRILKTEPDKEPVDIKSMIETAFCAIKNSSAVLEFETGMPEISADARMLRRVVSNLLSNAVKFSAPRRKPRIVAGCRREQDSYVFYIRDNGVGIDMAYAHKLFNIFQRLHGAGEFEGYGIGLASCKSIIAKHGGKIWIEGKVNAGATVYFTIPAEPVR